MPESIAETTINGLAWFLGTTVGGSLHSLGSFFGFGEGNNQLSRIARQVQL